MGRSRNKSGTGDGGCSQLDPRPPSQHGFGLGGILPALAVMQDKAVVGDVDANLAIIDRRAGEAAARRADVLVTPELFVTGYAPKRLHTVDPTQQIDIAGALAATAARHGIAVLASYPEVATADAPAARGGVAPGETARHIAATLFDTDGRPILHYRKVNLFDDDEAANDPA